MHAPQRFGIISAFLTTEGLSDSVSRPRKLGITKVGLEAEGSNKVNRSLKRSRVAEQMRVNKGKNRMKKLMIIAAAAAMTFAAQADIAWVDCPTCRAEGTETECQIEVFKVTASGKAVVMAKKGAYKTVGKLKVKKGALALVGTACPDGTCCYDNGFLLATVKAGNDKFRTVIPVDVKVWSAFGKNYDSVAGSNWRTLKKAKKVKLESALYISATGIGIDPDDDADSTFDDFVLEASAFGKAQIKVFDSKTSKTVCGKDSAECGFDLTIKNYSGWFVGYYTCIDADACFTCDCGLDPFGGTWKASYSAKSSGKNFKGAQKLAGTSFPESDGDISAE